MKSGGLLLALLGTISFSRPYCDPSGSNFIALTVAQLRNKASQEVAVTTAVILRVELEARDGLLGGLHRGRHSRLELGLGDAAPRGVLLRQVEPRHDERLQHHPAPPRVAGVQGAHHLRIQKEIISAG